jgi:hypothetical protein
MIQNSENFRSLVAQILNGARVVRVRAVWDLCRHPYPKYGGLVKMWHVIHRMTQDVSCMQMSRNEVHPSEKRAHFLTGAHAGEHMHRSQNVPASLSEI